MNAVADYEQLGTIGQSNLTIQKRHYKDKLLAKFKTKIIIVEDWIDIFDLVDGLIIHCASMIQEGWQKDELADFFTKLVHPVYLNYFTIVCIPNHCSSKLPLRIQNEKNVHMWLLRRTGT
jgi:hypothetical protein